MDFDNIYEEYFDRVYYKVLSVVKNDDDAEDICQETFISVYKNLSKFREESNIYTWIYRIAINKTYDFFKKRKLEFEINDDVLSWPEDINFDTNSISINKTRISKNETNEPKTKSSVRQITIPISVMKMLKEYIDKYTVIPEMLFSTYFIYTGKLTSMIKKNNLKKITLHDFRHSHASFLIKNGMDIASISKR